MCKPKGEKRQRRIAFEWNAGQYSETYILQFLILHFSQICAVLHDSGQIPITLYC